MGRINVYIWVLLVGFLGLMGVGFAGCDLNKGVDGGCSYYLFTPRKARHVWADNLQFDSVRNGSKTYVYYNLPSNAGEVKFSKYILSLNTCDVGVSEISESFPQYEELFNSNNYNPLYECPYMFITGNPSMVREKGDVEIEKNLQNYFEKSNTNTRANLVHVDYRTTPLRNIKIACSKRLLGIDAGESINRLLIIEGYDYGYVIGSNKRLVTNGIKGIGIDKYLASTPMAPVLLRLRFRPGLKVSVGETMTFKIDMELEDTIISTSIKPIALIP